MRLWHQKLINFLPREQLLGQHRECCALRGNGWGRKHATVDYVFEYSPYRLFMYHILIMEEMTSRGYKPNILWKDVLYRGKSCEPYSFIDAIKVDTIIYKEHNSKYLKECIENLESKNIFLELDERA